MPEHVVQQFYIDRRDRGMTDAMIVNELEATGWSLADAQAAVESAVHVYAPGLAAGMQKTADSLTYEVPLAYIHAMKSKGITIVATLWLLFASTLVIDTLANGFSLLVPLFAALIPIAGTWYFWKLHTAWVPRTITIDSNGVHLSSGSQKKMFTWSTFESFSVGTPQRLTGRSRYREIPIPETESAVISLYARNKQNAFTSEHQRYQTLPYPPQNTAEVVAFIKQFLREGDAIRAKPTLMDARGLVTIILAILLVLFMLYEGAQGLIR